MKKLALSIATATAAVAITFAGSSRADETQTTTTTTAPPPAVVQPAPAAQPQQPVQSVTVQAPPAQTSTTQTTAAPYAPPPQGQEMYAERSTEHLPNKTLLSTGIGLFVVSYGASVIAGAVSTKDEDHDLFVPVFGPWMDLNNRNNNGSSENLNKAMLVTSGIVQAGGVLLGVGSLFIPESTTTKEKHDVAKASVSVTPISFGAGAGVGAIGRF